MGGKAEGGRRLALAEAQTLADGLVAEMREAGAVTRAAVAGSVRRLAREVGDVDLVVIRGPGYDTWLAQRGGSGGKELSKIVVDGAQVDILATDEGGWGAALMHLTGPKWRNIAQRKKAKDAGFTLNEKGLLDSKGVRLSCSSDEKAIYAHMGWTWREAQERDKSHPKRKVA